MRQSTRQIPKSILPKENFEFDINWMATKVACNSELAFQGTKTKIDLLTATSAVNSKEWTSIISRTTSTNMSRETRSLLVSEKAAKSPLFKASASAMASRSCHTRLTLSYPFEKIMASCVRMNMSGVLVEDLLIDRASFDLLSVPAPTMTPPDFLKEVLSKFSSDWTATVVARSSLLAIDHEEEKEPPFQKTAKELLVVTKKK
jgi:hypothetical protein